MALNKRRWGDLGGGGDGYNEDGKKVKTTTRPEWILPDTGSVADDWKTARDPLPRPDLGGDELMVCRIRDMKTVFYNPVGICVSGNMFSEPGVVRISNLSPDTQLPEVKELFSEYGPIKYQSVKMDRAHLRCLGTGLVIFVNVEDAQRAIEKLNGYRLDDHIIQVYWGNPRAT